MAFRAQYDEDMVDCELEAAEALAVLAHSAVPTSDTSDCASPPPQLDLVLFSGVGSQVGKEARRLRRVLANRESARKTIRRRQAMYEELTKREAELALENENLKREKELAAKEHDSLRSTNDILKAQMSRVVKEEAQEKYSHSPVMQCIWGPTQLAMSNPASSFCVLPLPWLIPFHPLSSHHNESSPLHKGAGESNPKKIAASSGANTNGELYVKEQGVLARPVRNSEDAIAAMEARKRRKNIMKLKSLHCHGRPY